MELVLGKPERAFKGIETKTELSEVVSREDPSTLSSDKNVRMYPVLNIFRDNIVEDKNYRVIDSLLNEKF